MPQTRVSDIHDRDTALGMLIPTILGILWETGRRDELGVKAAFDKNIEIGASPIRTHAIMLSVWTPESKVLSFHLADDPASVVTSDFRYQSGRCMLLSWKRGTWEDRIMTSAAQPREIAQ